MKETQYYFNHDANAKDDPKCMILIDQMGLEGYGIFWVLIETLRNSQDYKYPIAYLQYLSKKYNTSKEKMEIVVKGYDLFEIDEDNYFFSLRLNRSMDYYLEQKVKKSIAGKSGMAKRWQNEQKTNKTDNKDITLLLQTDNTVVTELYQNDNIVITNDNYKIKENKTKKENIKENNKKEEKDLLIDKSYYSNYDLSYMDLNFKDIFLRYIDYKVNEFKKKYKTEQSFKIAYNNLIKLSNNNSDVANDIVENSIANLYEGLFAVRSNNGNNSKQSAKYPGGVARGDNKESDYDSYNDPKAWEF